MKLFILVIVCLTASGLFSGQNYIPLRESIEIALKNNKSILSEEMSDEASKWGLRQAAGHFIPKVDFNLTSIRIDDSSYDEINKFYKVPVLGPNYVPTGDFIPFSAQTMGGIMYRTTYRSNFTVTQPVFNGGRILYNYRINSVSKNLNALNTEDVKNEVVLEVIKTYYNILRLEQMKKLTLNNIDLVNSKLSDVRARFGQGLVKQSDVMQWQVRLNDLKTNLMEISNNLDLLSIYFSDLLGVNEAFYPEKAEFEIEDPEIYNIANLEETDFLEMYSRTVKEAMNNNTNLRQFKNNKKIFELQKNLARSNFLPSLNLQLSYDFDADNKINFGQDRSWSLTALLSVPLFRGGSSLSEYNKSRYELRAMEKKNEVLEQNILRYVKSTLYKTITFAKIILNSNESHSLAQENYRIISNIFAQDMLLNSDMLEAELMLYNSEFNLIDSYYNYKIAKYELDGLLNRLVNRFMEE